MLRAEREISHGDLFFHAIVHAINALVVKAGEMQHRFAHGFAGNGAGVDGRAAVNFHFVYQRSAFAELSRSVCGALARVSRSDYNDTVLMHASAASRATSLVDRSAAHVY